jgi:uncharacterized protein YqeY
MSLEAQINQDLKQAMLAKDQPLVSTLRMLKSAMLYLKVEQGSRDRELSAADVQALLAKEAKKRQESADLYEKGGNADSAQAELAEKAVIEKYLPEQLSEDDLRKLVEETAAALGASTPAQMGQVIGAVKGKVGASGDGAVIARLAKEVLGR